MKLTGTPEDRLYQAANAVMNQLTSRPYSSPYPLTNLERAAQTMPEGPKDPMELLHLLRSFVPQGPYVSIAVGTTGLERPPHQSFAHPQAVVEASLCVWDASGNLTYVHDELAKPPFPITKTYEESLVFAGLKPWDISGARPSRDVASEMLSAIRGGGLPVIGQNVAFALTALGRDAQGLDWESEVQKGAEGRRRLVGDAPVFDLMALAQLTFPYGFRGLPQIHEALTEMADGEVSDPLADIKALYAKDRTAVTYSTHSVTGENRSLRKALMVGEAARAANRVFSDPELFVRLETYLPEPIAPAKGTPRLFFARDETAQIDYDEAQPA